MTLQSILEELLRKYWKEHCGIDDYGCKDCKKYITQATLAIKQLIEGLLESYEEYIVLLKAELDEIAPMANVYGWKSSRYEQGVEARKKIADLKERLGKI